MDIEKIATLAARECIRQQVGLDRVGFLIAAYSDAAWLNDKGQGPTEKIILALAKVVEPDNRGQYRITPVTFKNGGGSVDHSMIPDLMHSLFVHIGRWTTEGSQDKDALARQFTKQFLWIHPFSDGNGRMAWILWNWLSDRLDNPLPLPDFDW